MNCDTATAAWLAHAAECRQAAQRRLVLPVPVCLPACICHGCSSCTSQALLREIALCDARASTMRLHIYAAVCYVGAHALFQTALWWPSRAWALVVDARKGGYAAPAAGVATCYVKAPGVRGSASGLEHSMERHWRVKKRAYVVCVTKRARHVGTGILVFVSGGAASSRLLRRRLARRQVAAVR